MPNEEIIHDDRLLACPNPNCYGTAVHKFVRGGLTTGNNYLGIFCTVCGLNMKSRSQFKTIQDWNNRKGTDNAE